MNYSHTESYHGYNDVYIAELITPVNDVKEIGGVKWRVLSVVSAIYYRQNSCK